MLTETQKNGAPLKWTEDMDSMLRDLWSLPPAELLTSAIGPKVREAYPNFQGALTKNAIIGRATRLGLPARGRPKAPEPEKPKEPEPQPMSATKAPTNSWVGHNIANKAKEAAKAPPEPEYTPEANNVPYLEAKDDQCMWPVGYAKGATIVCGCKRWNNGSYVRPSMYCAHHSRQGSNGPQTFTRKNNERRGRPAPRFS